MNIIVFSLDAVHKTWKKFLNKDILDELQSNYDLVGNARMPKDDEVLHFLSNDVRKVKVVILGTYCNHKSKTITGRYLENKEVNNWIDCGTNIVLKRLVEAIHNIYMDKKAENFEEVLESINNKTFNIVSPGEWFNSMESQGGIIFKYNINTCPQ